MVLVGGIRQRAVYDSVYYEINRALTALGWFDSGRQHLPIDFRADAVDPDTEVPFNTLVLMGENTRSPNELEMGSNYSDHRTAFYVDLFAESKGLGDHLIYDIRDILDGRMPSIGRAAPTIALYDYSQATPVSFSTAYLEFIEVDRAHRYAFPWQKNWYSCSFSLVDEYGDETF